MKLHRQSCSGGGGVGDEEDLDELPEYSEEGLGRCGVGGAPNPRHRRQQRRAVICDGIDDSSMTMMPPESSVSTHGQGERGEGAEPMLKGRTPGGTTRERKVCRRGTVH